MRKETNVFRIDTGRTHGWQVRICRDGDWHRKFFSDSKFESKEEAFEAAVEHRDEMLEELPDLPEGEMGQLRTEEVNERRWRALTRTGVKGLGFTMKKYSRASDDRRPYVNAHWTEEGTRRSTSVSIVKHGLRGALVQAARTLAVHTDHELTVDEMIETAKPALEQLLEEEWDASTNS